jgi:hypothetical protein
MSDAEQLQEPVHDPGLSMNLQRAGSSGIRAVEALEQQLRLLKVMHSDWGANAVASWHAEEASRPPKLLRGVARRAETHEIVGLSRLILREATPFYWETSCVDLARAASAKLPDSFCLAKQDLIVNTGFFWFPAPYASIHGRTWREDYLGFGWTVQDDDIFVFVSFVQAYIVEEGRELPVLHPIPIRFFFFSLGDVQIGEFLDSSVPEASNEIRVARIERTRFEIAAILFVGQKILLTQTLRPPRAMRRRAEAAPALRDYRVVRLRERDAAEAHRSDQTGIEWSCRWAVRGHWRNQFYPSKANNRTIWIDPYIKGPDGKPFRASSTIFDVGR